MKTKIKTIYRTHPYSFIFGAADTSKTAEIDPTLGISGEVCKLIVIIPNWTNTVTLTVSTNNADSKEIFITESMAQNDEYDITLSRNECIILGQENEEFKVTLSGVPGGSGGTATVTAYVEE